MRCDANVVHQDRIGVGGDALPKISDDKTVIVGGCYAASTITHFVRLDFGQSIYYLVCPINVAREQPSWAPALHGLHDQNASHIARPPLPSAAVNRTQRPKRAPGSVLSQEKKKNPTARRALLIPPRAAAAERAKLMPQCPRKYRRRGEHRSYPRAPLQLREQSSCPSAQGKPPRRCS
jgi:hypothetical protein